MNIFGKILVWVTLVGALLAIVLTSEMVVVRNSWTQQIETLQQSNQQKAHEIAEKELQLRQLRSEFARVMLGWDKAWDVPAADATVNPNTGVFATRNFGTGAGFGSPSIENQTPVPTAYVFRVSGEQSEYVGSFRPSQPTDLQEAQLTLQPTWQVRQSDQARFARPQDPSGAWRIRTRIPAANANRFDKFATEFSDSDELLAKTQADLADQTEQVEVAKTHLGYRLEELLGPENPAEVPQPGDQFAETKIGLVKAIEAEEERRNEVLAYVDHLRRLLRAANIKLDSLIQENRRLVQDLVQKTTLTTAEANSP